LGINLIDVINDPKNNSPNNNKIMKPRNYHSRTMLSKFISRKGYIIELDVYQQVWILKKLIEYFPELKKSIGFYNIRGSKKVFEALSELEISGNWGIRKMFTGESYLEPEFLKGGDFNSFLNSSNRPVEGFIFVNNKNLSRLAKKRFIFGDLQDGGFSSSKPYDFAYRAGVVLGTKIEE